MNNNIPLSGAEVKGTLATPATVMDWLIAAYPHALRTTLRRMLSDGRVMINGSRARSLKQTLTVNDQVALANASTQPLSLPEGLKIIHEDADIIVVEKPAGLLTATHDQETRPTALAILNRHVSRKNKKSSVFLVHRLDRHASGLLVFARGTGALAKLKEQFRHHTITREYHVVVHGRPQPPTGRLSSHIMERHDRMMEICSADNGKPAILDYRVLPLDRKGEQSGKTNAPAEFSRVECRLFTGRKHQIRVQFKSIGHPVVGDPIYGPATLMAGKGDAAPIWPRLALHATRLEFKHPRTGKDMEFLSAVPRAIRMPKSRPVHPLYPRK